MLQMNNISSKRRSAFSLIEILVVVVIIVALSAVSYNVFLGHSKNGLPGKAHAPIERAKDAVCMTNLRSVRQSIEAFRAGDTDSKNPDSLIQLRELPAELRACPEGNEPYQYDPTTGQVHCVHPGHENY